ncbi:hypothetical protein [Rhizobium leguminosarum]|uniref:hypothetical protein n=1 Tax=Rhizobium leguminosarum TaxID=384 RepID=UPI003F9E22E1
MDIINWFGDGRVGSLIGIAGIAIGVALPFWFRQKALMRYATLEASIASTYQNTRFKDDLEIYFKGVSVPIVTGTIFWIWNGGNTTIHSHDIAPSDRLRLVLPQDSTILRFSIGKSSRLVNNARHVISDGAANTEVIIDFDFLEPNEGFLCELVHTAPKKAAGLRGTIINSRRSPLYSTVLPSRLRRDILKFRRLVGALFFALAALFITERLFPQQLEDPEWLKEFYLFFAADWVQYTIAAIFIVFGLLTLFWPMSKIPPSLEDDPVR